MHNENWAIHLGLTVLHDNNIGVFLYDWSGSHFRQESVEDKRRYHGSAPENRSFMAGPLEEKLFFAASLSK